MCAGGGWGTFGSMRTWIRLVLRHRFAVLVVVGLVTIAAGVIASQGVLASSIARLFLGDSPAYARFLTRAADFGSDELIVIGFDEPDLLGAESRARLARIAERLEEWPEVAQVLTPLDARRIEAGAGGLSITAYAEEAEAADAAGLGRLREEMRRDPFVADTLLARAGPAAAIIIELHPDGDRDAETGPLLLERAGAVLAEEGIARDRQHHVGQIAAVAELIVQTKLAIVRIFPFCAGLLLVTVWLLFGRLWPAALAVGVSLLAVVWTAGFAVLLDREVSIMMALVPSVILIVAFSDIVHLVSAYLIELGHRESKDEALFAAGVDVGRACLFTSLTTFLGFVSLSFVPTPVFRVTGLVMGFGVAIALLIAMTVVPIVFSLMPAPAPLREGGSVDAGRAQRALDALLRGVRRVAIGRPWWVIGGFVGVMGVAGYGALGLQIETNVVERMGPENRLRQDVAWFEAGFAGTNVVDLYVSAPEVDGLLDPARFAAIARLEAAVEALPLVDDAQSLVDLMRRLHGALAGPEAGPLPTTRPQLAQYLLLFEMAGGEGLSQVVDFDRRLMRIRLRLSDNGFRASEAVGDAAVALAREYLDPATTVEPSGMSYLLGDWLDAILSGQRNGLLFSVGTIALMMVVALRSLGAGLWSMIPNLFPLVVLVGWLGGVWSTADSDVFVVLVIAVGIGVDDTVHFLVRYRSECARTADRRLALARTFDFAGRAIVMTTVILTAGFLPFAMSDYFSAWILGTMLPACLVLALLADLLLVPAMAAVGWIGFRAPKG